MKYLASLAFAVIFLAVCLAVPVKLAICLIGAWSFIATMLLIWRTSPKPKPVVITTAALIAAMVAAPMNVQARPSDGGEDDQDLIAIGICVLVVGGTIAYGLYKLCQRIPQPPRPDNFPPPPPPTNNPPFSVGTNAPTIRTNSGNKIKITSAAHPAVFEEDISRFGYTSPATGEPITRMWWYSIEQSPDLNTWSDSLSLTGYVSASSEYISAWTNGVCAANILAIKGQTNYVPVELGTGEEKAKFFRTQVVP